MENPITTMLPKHSKHVVEAKWPSRELLELLGVTHPIIQAPMSGYVGPALVAAVSNAGALGSLGCGPWPPQAVRDQIEENSPNQQPTIQSKFLRAHGSTH